VTFEERQFRQALGAFPTGVAVVTGITAAGERLGMTVSSFNSVSITPPLVLFSVARRAHSFAAWTQMSHYAINVLSQEQETISNRFARPLGEKWEGLLVVDGAIGVPLLPNALAAFECAAYAQYDGGDHAIFVGRVEALHTTMHRQEQPLIFFGGRYRRLDAAFRDVPPPDISIFAGW
jgi:flavin reductase (DIM6/NTAB) family NADH-FMN oxidoreductase RutF